MSPGGSRGRFGRWLTSFSGIATAVAGIMTSAATILGFFAAHQYAQIHDYRTQVQRQSKQLQQLQARPAARVTAGANSVTGGGALSAQEYLSNQQPTVNNGNANDEGTTLLGRSYPSSVVFYCDGQSNGQPTQAWDVGGLSTFTAVVGIPDNSPSVTGYVGTLTFTSQDGKQLGKNVTVSLGHPAHVTLNISGVTQLDITCNATDPANSGAQVGNLQAALANARAF